MQTFIVDKTSESLSDSEYTASGYRNNGTFAGLSEKVEYFNNTSEDTLWIINRSNVRTPLKRLPPLSRARHYPADCLVVQTSRTFSDDLQAEYRAQAKATPEALRSPQEQVNLSQGYKSFPGASLVKRAHLVNEDLIPYDSIAQADGVLYVVTHDLVVVLESMVGGYAAVQKMEHPYSRTALLRKHTLVPEGWTHSNNNFFMGISIRVPKGHTPMASKWVVVGESVFEIRCEEMDEDCHPPIIPGYYVTASTASMEGRRSNNSIVLHHFLPEDVGKIPHLKLYDSFQEARASMDVHKQTEALTKLTEVEAKLRESDNKLKRSDMEHSRAIEEHVQARLEAEAKARRAATEALYAEEKARMERESMASKAKYEKESTDRKNTSELLKYVPLALQTIILVVGLFSKVKK